MRVSLAAFALAVVSSVAPALLAQHTRLLRQPTVSDRHIAFAYANDIWIVTREGGDARRVTSFQGTETDPALSPDGQWIAFTGQYDGNVDVFLVSIAGGEPRRLTWHPGPDQVRGWTPDGTRVVFATARTGAPVPYNKLWTISRDGGMPEALPMPRAHRGQFSPDGRRFAYQPISLNDSEWRNYRGGQIRPIWVLDLQSYALEKLPWNQSNDLNPTWLGNTIYFLSDRDHAMNLYSYDGTGGVRQLTRHRDFDIKHVSAGGGAVVYEQAGRIHLYDPAQRKARPVEITVRGDFAWARPHWENVGQMLANASLSPTGVRALFEARGEIITVPTEKGDYRNLTRSPGVADRNPSWSPDGQHVAWFSDRSGNYRLMIGGQNGMEAPREIALPNPTFYFTPTWSPDSKHLAYTDTDLNLWYVEIESGEAKLVDTDQYAHPERTVDPVWAPHSKAIAYAKRLDNQFHAIMVYSLEDGQIHQLTDGMSDARSPAWDKSGKFLYFLASTNYALNTGWLDMSSYERPIRRGIYLAVLQADEPSPLLPESDEEKADKDEEPEAKTQEGEEKKEGGEAKEETPGIDWEGIDQRILALDVPARNYTSLTAGLEGVIFYTEAVENQPGQSLHRYELSKREAKPFLSGLQSYAISADGKKLLYQAGPAWGVVGTSGPAKVGDGTLNTAVSMRVEPEAEWRQMFREAWRYQRDFLYVENLHGADWDEVYRMYSPWLSHVRHRSDLNYLLDVLGGEVSIGHSFVFGGDNPDVDQVPVGLLGADLAVEGGRYRLAKIYTGENWNPDLRAPLSAPGLDVSEGDYILAVNGVDLPATANPYRLLEGTAGRQTVLRINDRPSTEGSRVITVVPVESEVALRSRDWVEGNRRKVDEMSGGRLAYVWLPNTGGGGYTYFNRYYFAQQHKEGAVMDERFNGGGSAADYMVDIMSRELIGFMNSPVGERKPFTVPGSGIWGPKVMIINDAAGSGGDLLPYMFRHLGIGPLVGTRTWGGLVGIWDVPPLIDGGFITAPRGGFYNLKGEWEVENEGVAPDIEVEQTPKDVIAGRDPQLERAVHEALRLLDQTMVVIQPEPAPPVRAKRPGQ